MVEHQQIFPDLDRPIEPELIQPGADIPRFGRGQPGSDQDPAQRADVAPQRHSSQKRRLDQGGSPPHERIVNPVPRAGETLDEESGKLSFEASPVGDLVQGVPLPLHRGPELVDVPGNELAVDPGVFYPGLLIQGRKQRLGLAIFTEYKPC